MESRKSSRYAENDNFQFDGHVRRVYKTSLPVLLPFHVGFKKLCQLGFSTKYKVQDFDNENADFRVLPLEKQNNGI